MLSFIIWPWLFRGVLMYLNKKITQRRFPTFWVTFESWLRCVYFLNKQWKKWRTAPPKNCRPTDLKLGELFVTFTQTVEVRHMLVCNSNSNSNRLICKGYIPSRQMCRCSCAYVKNKIMVLILSLKKRLLVVSVLKIAHDGLFESLYWLLFNDTTW